MSTAKWKIALRISGESKSSMEMTGYIGTEAKDAILAILEADFQNEPIYPTTDNILMDSHKAMQAMKVAAQSDRRSFGEVHPRNTAARCKCEHWQYCADCHPTAHAQPAYPEGLVIGPCVCGSWPGGECLKCTWIPAQPVQPTLQNKEPK